MSSKPLIDIHQHVWTPALIDALGRRDSLPLVRGEGGGLTLHLEGEPSCPLPPRGETSTDRQPLLCALGADRALIAISSPLGIEALPRDAARGLIDAHLEGATMLGENFGVWGPVPVNPPQAADVDRVLADGCVGISMPAGALADADALGGLLAVLHRTEELNVPLFVHPGPGRTGLARTPSPREPRWWPAATTYVAQMHAAWITFNAFGRAQLPGLRVVFAMLAGLAPLHRERLASRGAGFEPDPRIFFDTSSYGPRATAAMREAVGAEQIVFGSDLPVVEPRRASLADWDGYSTATMSLFAQEPPEASEFKPVQA